MKRHDVGVVAAAIVVEKVFFQWIGRFPNRRGVDIDDNILEAAVWYGQIGLVRQCLAAIILILAYFD